MSSANKLLTTSTFNHIVLAAPLAQTPQHVTDEELFKWHYIVFNIRFVVVLPSVRLAFFGRLVM